VHRMPRLEVKRQGGTARGLARIVGLNTLGAIAPTLVFLWFGDSASLADAWRTFVVSTAYAQSVGTLAGLILPWVGHNIRPKRPVLRWGVFLAFLFGISATGSLLGSLFVHRFVYSFAPYWKVYWMGFRVSTVVMLVFGVGAFVVESLRAQLQVTELELRTKELERERALKLASEARLSSLESRVQPHFLFNALNSIASLLREDPRAAERLIEGMAALMRYSLDHQQSGLTALAREMKIVRDYLAIEQARFGARLRYEIDVPDDLMAEVPPFAIQTLVENSVKYAVAPRIEGGSIRVSARAGGPQVMITVADDGPGFDEESLMPGHGLDNLRSRLAALYGGAGHLRLHRDEGAMQVSLAVRAEVAA